MAYSKRLVDAFAMAFELHDGQQRKGSDIPYITHLMGVAALVGEYGGTEDQVIAALLHDAVEDQGGPVTLSLIRDEFGDLVAQYVYACSDSDTLPKPPWRERKDAYLARLASEPPDVRLISAADKLFNTRSMYRDLKEMGNSLWERFHGKRDGTLWYLKECLRALSDGWNHPILEAFEEALAALYEEAERHTPGRHTS